MEIEWLLWTYKQKVLNECEMQSVSIELWLVFLVNSCLCKTRFWRIIESLNAYLFTLVCSVMLLLHYYNTTLHYTTELVSHCVTT